MTVADAIKYLRDTEKITLFDVDQSGWRSGAITKDYIPPVYLTWEVVGLQLDWCDLDTPVLELDIKPVKCKDGLTMVEPELIRKSDARAAVLHDSPASSYCIDRIKSVDARINVYGVWLDAGKNVHGQNLTRCSVCNANSIEGGRFCRCCGAVMKQ